MMVWSTGGSSADIGFYLMVFEKVERVPCLKRIMLLEVLSVECEPVSSFRETADLRRRLARAIGVERRHGWL